MNKEQRLQYWNSIIDECYVSDEPVISWCSRKGVNESCFYKWRKIIYQEYSKSVNLIMHCLLLLLLSMFY